MGSVLTGVFGCDRAELVIIAAFNVLFLRSIRACQSCVSLPSGLSYGFCNGILSF